MHAFNRYEVKYVVPVGDVPALRAELDARMGRDSHGDRAGYGVWSVYYDTDRLRFYWEKIEGLRFRRKLRVRHYGDRSTITDDSIVHVEIKQRVNRVTQKRRVALPYRLARDFCDRREMVAHHPDQRAFLEEVLELVCGLDLRPVAMTGYQREAFVGRDSDVGLRVTIDHRVRGRDRDFHLGAEAENRLIVPATLAVVEIKANERVPYWLTDLAARANLSIVRMSKYCQSDTEFDEQLADRVDVESFARYVAWQNLLLNFDDMSGPGRNYYLWYDLTSKKFTVVGWDYNLTFSGDAGQGPHEQGRLGGGFRGGGATRPMTGQQDAENEGAAPPGFTAPGTDPPAVAADTPDARPDRAGRPDTGGPGDAGPGNGRPDNAGRGDGGPGGGGPGGAGPGGGGGHLLKERFLARETFTQVYEDAYRELYRQVYADGAALAALDGITEVLSSVDGQDAQTVTDDADRLRTLIGQRTESLAADPVITQS
ncbi:VTC domain-containing protein [Micromonospora craniellae]|uniref:VTC domain-containing protein n=1 Tax=Micromonospora craniellae TaxID=2294034 RepID=UPI001CC3EE54|nr:VTC domain-containing protein [Micromonospora craniellae]